MFECLPSQFECEALLRVHHLDLARRHLEEVGVEALDVVEVAALEVGLVEHLGDPRIRLELGPAILGEVADAVAAVDQQVPGGFRGVARLRETCCHPDDRDVVVRASRAVVQIVVVIVLAASIRVALDDALGQRRDRRVLVRDGGGEDDAGLVLDVARQRNRVARGQAELFHRPVVGDLVDRQSGRVGDPLPQPLPELRDRQVTGLLVVLPFLA